MEHSTGWRAFLRSYLVGCLFFAGTTWWVGHVTVPGMLVLVAYLALYFGAWGWFASFTLHRSPFTALFSLPAAWVAFEYARSFLLSGFGWNLLAHTQWNWISLIQIADVTGVWGVSFLVMLVNVALYGLVKGERWKVKGILLTALCVLAAWSYGVWCLRLSPPPLTLHPSPSFRVALLQGSVPQTQKWDEAFQEAIWKRYEQLTAEAAGREPDLVVWPETAVPGFLEEPEVRQRLGRIAISSGRPLAAGIPTEDRAGPVRPGSNGAGGNLYNSAVLLSPGGAEEARYNKRHLVPFGEFIPFKPILGWLENVVPIGDFSAGKEFTVFQPGRPVLPFSVLICFEDLFPELSRQFVRHGARWLVVMTNDGWFGRSAASLQHLQCSVFRAVENRVWIGRAANTGWTGVVGPSGRRGPPPAQIPRFQPGIAEADLPISPWVASAYVRWGNWFALLCLAGTGWALFPTRRRL